MSLRDRLTLGISDHFTMPEEFLTLADWIEQQGYICGEDGYIRVANKKPIRIFAIIKAPTSWNLSKRLRTKTRRG